MPIYGGIFAAIPLAALLLTLVRLERVELGSGGEIMEATTYAAHDDLPNIFSAVGILPVQYGSLDDGSCRRKANGAAVRRS